MNANERMIAQVRDGRVGQEVNPDVNNAHPPTLLNIPYLGYTSKQVDVMYVCWLAFYPC